MTTTQCITLYAEMDIWIRYAASRPRSDVQDDNREWHDNGELGKTALMVKILQYYRRNG